MTYQRGDVVWAADPYRSGSNPRPWIVISNATLPYADQEYIALVLTTHSHPGARRLTTSVVNEGVDNLESYIKE